MKTSSPTSSSINKYARMVPSFWDDTSFFTKYLCDLRKTRSCYPEIDNIFGELLGISLRVFEFLVVRWKSEKDPQIIFLAMMRIHLNLSSDQLRLIL